MGRGRPKGSKNKVKKVKQIKIPEKVERLPGTNGYYYLCKNYKFMGE